MSVKKQIPFDSGIFFITFTCAKWIPLFKATNYKSVYNWFDYLYSQGHHVNAFVIMPNHLHTIISFRKSNKSINQIIGNGKRFMAYEIIRQLKSKQDYDTLNSLQSMVSASDKKVNKKHQVFESSFDWKLCESTHFQSQKLHYIHNNPVRTQLARNAKDYKHSSARQYLGLSFEVFKVTHIGIMQNFDFGQDYLKK